MPFISVTRLRLRSLRFFPGLVWHTWTSTRQIRGARGFVTGQLASEGLRGFWTVTAWSDEAAMRAYRNTEAHMRAMPRLLEWCDEASVVHWEQPTSELPEPAAALARMRAEGRLSKVSHPSAGHAARQIAPGEQVPRAGLRLQPSREA